MSLTIELPKAVENRLRAGAERSKQSVAEYIERLITMESPPRPVTLQETLTPEEFVQSLKEWASSLPQGLPILSDDAISRESIYDRASSYEGRTP